MNVMQSLFTYLPEMFNILEELNSYIDRVVIPVGLGVQDFISFQNNDPTFPMITLTNLAINLITDALPFLSQSFLIRMMEKHRLSIKSQRI